MHEPGRSCAAPRVDRLFERVQHEIRPQRRGHAPADNPAGKDIDDERDVDKARPRRHVSEVRHPELIRPRGLKLAVDQIAGTIKSGLRLGGRDPRAAPHHASHSHRPHQALDRAPSHVHTTPSEFPPDLPRAVHLEVRVVDALDLDTQLVVAPSSG